MLNPHLIFNKLIALVLIGIGAFVMWLDNDGTFLVFALILGVPLLFAKENWTTIEVREIAEDEELSAATNTPKTSRRAV